MFVRVLVHACLESSQELWGSPSLTVFFSCHPAAALKELTKPNVPSLELVQDEVLIKLHSERTIRAGSNFQLFCNVTKDLGPINLSWKHNVSGLLVKVVLVQFYYTFPLCCGGKIIVPLKFHGLLSNSTLIFFQFGTWEVEKTVKLSPVTKNLKIDTFDPFSLFWF